MTGTKPVHNQFSTLSFLALASVAESAIKRIRNWTSWGAPTTASTTEAASPIIKNNVPFTKEAPPLTFKAEPNTESPLYSRIFTVAGTVLSFANGLSWNTLGIAGATLGAFYLYNRYWKSSGGINNTNNNNVHINIHFTGIQPASVEKSKDGATVHVNMAPLAAPLPEKIAATAA